MANGNRNALGAIGGLTQGLFRGVTTGIGLQQRQQALDREKLESELGLFNHIAKLPHGSFKKAAMGRFLPRLGFTQDTTDLLTKANEEDQEYLNRALTNIIEQLPQDMGFSGFKELVGRMTPEQIINLVGVGLQIEGIKSQRAGQQAIQGALSGQAETEQPQPQPREGAAHAANALAANLRAQRDQLTVLMASTGIGAPQKEAIKTRISSINRDIERIEGMSPTQFSQQLQLSRERGAAAVAQQPVPTETAKQLSELEATLEQVENVEKLYKPEFVGPIKGRVAGIKEATTGQISEEQIEMRAALRDAADFLLRARSGAQINEQEFRRMMTFLPQDNLPPKVFEVRLSRFKRELQTLIRTKKRLAGTSRGEVVGQPTKSGVDYIYDPKTGTLKKVGE